MNLIIVCALSASIVISVMRNLLSKSVSGFSFGTAEFFGVQSALFAGGFFCLFCACAFWNLQSFENFEKIVKHVVLNKYCLRILRKESEIFTV